MPPCRSCEGGQRTELRFAGAPPAALLFESYGDARPCDIAEVRAGGRQPGCTQVKRL